jgi:RecB family exonuclease
MPAMEVFSYSRVTAFRNCPKAYEFRYVVGESERFTTIERHMGSAVHEALRWAWAEREEGREPLPRQIVERFDTSWWSAGLSGAVVVKTGLRDEDYRLEGRRMVETYARGLFRRDHSETLGLENRFQIRLNDRVRLTGVVDRVARSPEGKLRIIDYKTGSRVPNPLSDPQLIYYAAWAFEVYSDPSAELTFLDLRGERELTAEFHRRAIVPYIESLVEEIATITRTERFEPRPSLLCKWCGFNPICDAVEPSLRPPQILEGQPAVEDCPQCGAALVARKGRFGSFVGCSGYPGCRYTRDDW